MTLHTPWRGQGAGDDQRITAPSLRFSVHRSGRGGLAQVPKARLPWSSKRDGLSPVAGEPVDVRPVVTERVNRSVKLVHVRERVCFWEGPAMNSPLRRRIVDEQAVD